MPKIVFTPITHKKRSMAGSPCELMMDPKYFQTVIQYYYYSCKANCRYHRCYSAN